MSKSLTAGIIYRSDFSANDIITIKRDNIEGICSIKYVNGGIHRLTDFGVLYEGNGIADSLKWKNTSLIQMVIDSVGRVGGGIIDIPSGTYCLNGEPGGNCISIKYNNITLRGAGMTKTRLCTNNTWDPVKKARTRGVRIYGTRDKKNPRTNIILQDFELDGGAGWTGKYRWAGGKFPDEWDISHKGIITSADDITDNITLKNLNVHSYRGEILYSGGLGSGKVVVKGCKMYDTNGSCLNLFGAKLLVDSTELSGPTRFWVELQARASHNPVYSTSEASFTNCTFKDAVGEQGIAICQGDNTTVTHTFINNTFSNAPRGLFLFTGGIAGPVNISKNRIYNCGGDTLKGAGYLLDFYWGGNTENPKDNRWVKNITFSDNIIENSACLLSLKGSWDGVPMVVENLNIINNKFIGKDSLNPEKIPSIIYGESISWYNGSKNNCYMSNIKIANNVFSNCAAPKQIGKVLGERPLFSGNRYLNYSNTLTCNVDNRNPIISPQCEQIIVKTIEKNCLVELDTANYPDGQCVKISGGSSKNKIKLNSKSNTFLLKKDFVLNGKKEIRLRFDSSSGKWMSIENHL